MEGVCGSFGRIVAVWNADNPPACPIPTRPDLKVLYTGEKLLAACRLAQKTL